MGGEQRGPVSFRESVRQADRPVLELEFGMLVYPPEAGREPWRAVFTENGQRRYRQGATEAKLAEKLEKVREWLSAGEVNQRLGYRETECVPASCYQLVHLAKIRTPAPE